MTIMDYFKEKPERATIYLVKRGCGHVSEFETEEGKTMEESIEDYLCSAGLCEFCPAKPYDDVCEDRLKKWLNLPVDELGGWTYGEYANSIDDLDPEDREVVQKILDAAMKSAKEKKVMYSPEGTAEFKEFKITDAVQTRADGKEWIKAMDRKKMDEAINLSRNTLENIYRAAYDAGRRDADWERNEGYAVNKLNQLASALRSEIKERGASSYIADGLWIALREIDELKEYIESGGDEER